MLGATERRQDGTPRIRRSLSRDENADVAWHRRECRSERLLESAVFQQTQGRVDEEQLGLLLGGEEAQILVAIIGRERRCASLDASRRQRCPARFELAARARKQIGILDEGGQDQLARRLRDEWLGELEQRPDRIRAGRERPGSARGTADGSAGTSSPEGGATARSSDVS